VTVFHDAGSGKDFIVGQEVGKITNTIQLDGAATPDASLKSGDPGPLYRFKAWLSRFLED
jgi:hypothetical protein